MKYQERYHSKKYSLALMEFKLFYLLESSDYLCLLMQETHITKMISCTKSVSFLELCHRSGFGSNFGGDH
jgi:hypothetical protein